MAWQTFFSVFGTVFLNPDATRPLLRDGDDVVEITRIAGRGVSHLIHLLVEQMFDGRNPGHVVHQLLHPCARHFDDILIGASHAGSDRRFCVVDARRLPGFD